ncbi:hypothetical protein DZB84_04480 [Bacillus sp. HNG]|uniref:hypothetical protein n=1 Tax=Bacillus sp. HNG TaxID=2293325 RepID=UPI000E2F09CB|nr:hypothetical protein [Bacillus sp. HNG]RFB18178.1 hypothetical protein DZB84_04480 [Bacillus sp. HNG]
MNKFDKEIERFMTDYSKDHEEAIGKLDKWAAENEKGLNQLDKQASGFEKELETMMGKLDGRVLEHEKGLNQLDTQASGFEKELEPKMEKLDQWFSKKQGELEKRWENNYFLNFRSCPVLLSSQKQPVKHSL